MTWYQNLTSCTLFSYHCKLLLQVNQVIKHNVGSTGKRWCFDSLTDWLNVNICSPLKGVLLCYAPLRKTPHNSPPGMMTRPKSDYRKISNIRRARYQNLNVLCLGMHLSLRNIYWNQVLSGGWRCSWSSADRRRSNYIWVINHLIIYQGVFYIRDLTVITEPAPAVLAISRHTVDYNTKQPSTLYSFEKAWKCPVRDWYQVSF